MQISCNSHKVYIIFPGDIGYVYTVINLTPCVLWNFARVWRLYFFFNLIFQESKRVPKELDAE